MIEDRAIQPVGNAGQAPGRQAVGSARPGIAAWVRVAENDTRASAASSIGDDCVDGQGGLRLIAVMAAEVDAVQLLIDMGDEQALSSWIGFSEAAGEEIAGCCESVELERPFGTLMAHAYSLGRRPSSDDLNHIQNGYPFRTKLL